MYWYWFNTRLRSIKKNAVTQIHWEWLIEGYETIPSWDYSRVKYDSMWSLVHTMILRWLTSFLLKCILIHLTHSVRYDAVKQQTGRYRVSLYAFHLVISQPIMQWGFLSSTLFCRLFKIVQDKAISDQVMKEILTEEQNKIQQNPCSIEVFF